MATDGDFEKLIEQSFKDVSFGEPPPVTVVMKSEEYGDDTFTYETMDKALEAIGRLIKSSQQHFKEDGITREIGVIIGDWGGE